MRQEVKTEEEQSPDLSGDIQGRIDHQGERLAKARGEFQKAWQAKVAEKEWRVQRLRRWSAQALGWAEDWGQATWELLKASPVFCVIAVIPFVGKLLCWLAFFLILVGVAIFAVGIAAGMLLGWAANRLETREIKHL